MSYQIKLKEKPEDREFIVMWEGDVSATVEVDSWNYCDDIFYKKYNKDNRFEFRKIDTGTPVEAFSYPQNRQVRDNIAMTNLKRQYKGLGGE